LGSFVTLPMAMVRPSSRRVKRPIAGRSETATAAAAAAAAGEGGGGGHTHRGGGHVGLRETFLRYTVRRELRTIYFKLAWKTEV